MMIQLKRKWEGVRGPEKKIVPVQLKCWLNSKHLKQLKLIV